MSETVIYHVPSKTLITTDLFTYFNSSSAASGALAGRLTGSFEKLTINTVFASNIADKTALKESLKEVLTLPFVRISLGHGQLYQSPDVKKDMKTAFQNCKNMEFYEEI